MGKILVLYSLVVFFAVASNAQGPGQRERLEKVMRSPNTVIEKMESKLHSDKLVRLTNDTNEYANSIMLHGEKSSERCCSCPTDPSTFVFGNHFIATVSLALKPLDSAMEQPCSVAANSAKFDRASARIMGTLFQTIFYLYSQQKKTDKCPWIAELFLFYGELAMRREITFETSHTRSNTVTEKELESLSYLLGEIKSITSTYSVNSVNQTVNTIKQCCYCSPRVTIIAKNNEHFKGIFKKLAVLDSQMDRLNLCDGSFVYLFKELATTAVMLERAKTTFDATRKFCVEPGN